MDTPSPFWMVTEVEVPETPDVTGGGRGSEDVGGTFAQPNHQSPTQPATRRIQKRVPLDAIALKTQMQGLLQVVGEVFDQTHSPSGLQLEEVELAVEINAEGQVSILGNGGKLADKGGIKLKFKRATS
jgi:hypothetical protein